MNKAEEKAGNYMQTLYSGHRVMGITQDTRGMYYTRYWHQPFYMTGPGMSLEQAIKKCHLEKADFIQFNSCCHDALMPIDEAVNMLNRKSEVDIENFIQQSGYLLDDIEDNLTEMLDIVLTQCDQEVYSNSISEVRDTLQKIVNFKTRISGFER